MFKKGLKIARGLGRFVKSRSPEAKAAGGGAVALGSGVAATGVGTHIGVAAIGSAVSGGLIIPLAAAAFGAISGYALYKRHKEKRRNVRLKEASEK